MRVFRPFTWSGWVAFATLVIGLTGCGEAHPKSTVRLLVGDRDIALGGDTSRYDYASIDAATHRLYLAHLGASEVVVVDLVSAAVVGRVPAIRSVHGVLAPAGMSLWFATATATGELVAVDGTTARERWRVLVGAFPDGIGFDAASRTVAVANKADGTISMIPVGSDARPPTSARTRTVRIGTEAGNVVSDPDTGTFLAASAAPASLVEIRPDATVMRRVALQGCSGAHGVAVAAADRVVLVACEGNAKVVSVDLRSFTQTAAFTVGSVPDVLAVDPALHRVYVAAEDGPVTVIATRRGASAVLGQVGVGPNAHTVAVDSVTHAMYFALHDLDGAPILRVMRPQTKP